MATTTKTAAGPVIDAIYDALNVAAITAAPPTGFSCGVYDDVPQTAAFPYLRISTPTGIPFDTFGTAGKERTVQVSVFSQYEGTKEAHDILDKVVQLLNHQALAITGHTTVLIDYEQDGGGAEEDVNGVKTVHTWARFRVIVQEV